MSRTANKSERSAALLMTLLTAPFIGCSGAETEPNAAVDPDQPPVTGNCVPGAETSDPFADCIDAFSPGPGATFGHSALPDIVLGAPVPGAGGGGGMDVASLGCGGTITLMFDGEGLQDRDGDDLIVFENPFATGDTTFAEPAQVLVSDDGDTWYGFGCEPSGDGSWPPVGCAGVSVVAPSDGDFDPGSAGGDRFDLADVGLASARYVRLVDVTEAHYGDSIWCAGSAGGFDLDAVAAATTWPAALSRQPPEPR